ncbi:hypothetical protein [Paraburkholderia sp. RL17-373-BIF-A]|uniref:hypothetical protein n=1 Tax=Paraburkholderia sp. RL17-373-BIF-A TaxID=3031629 RepID=UPI0038BB12CC
MLLATEPAWYIDTQAGVAGIVQLPLQSLQAQQLAAYLAMPPISLTEAPLVGAVLREIVPELPPPPAPNSSELRIIDTEPVPILSLDTRPLYMAGFGKYDHRAPVLDFAAVGFDVSIRSVPSRMALTHARIGY